MTHRRIAVCLLTLALIVACGQKQEQTDKPQPATTTPNITLAQLADWMTGSFSSADQATEDSAFFDIRLEMSRIWPERTDGYWLYIEQAAASSLERPYRQRIYHLIEADSTTFASAVFEMTDPERFTGRYAAPETFAILTPDSLIERTGCVIFLHPETDTSVVGSTRGEECLSSLRGAAYATSEVRITPNALMSWDRGYDSTGTQVWGAEKGGYIFTKLKDYPLDPAE
jgi:hypothetical protein